MSKKYISINEQRQSLVKTEPLNRLSAHLKMAADMLEELPSDKPETMNLTRARIVIAKHHRSMFVHANQKEPDEADQQYLDELTESLLKQLFE